MAGSFGGAWILRVLPLSSLSLSRCGLCSLLPPPYFILSPNSSFSYKPAKLCYLKSWEIYESHYTEFKILGMISCFIFLKNYSSDLEFFFFILKANPIFLTWKTVTSYQSTPSVRPGSLVQMRYQVVCLFESGLQKEERAFRRWGFHSMSVSFVFSRMRLGMKRDNVPVHSIGFPPVTNVLMHYS